MSHLKKLRNNNLKIYEKSCAFLKGKGLDINNLPRVQAKKPVIEVKQVPVKYQAKIEHEHDDSDSEGIDLSAYFPAQKTEGARQNHPNRQ